MKGHSSRAAALVLAVMWGGAAWAVDTTIDYHYHVTENNRGGSYLGGKTITLDWTGTQPAAGDVKFVGVPVNTLPSRFGGTCLVLVSGGGGSGTMDIEVPPEQGGWTQVVGITAGDSVPINFTYWRKPALTTPGGELPGSMQQRWEGDWILIYGENFPDPVSEGGTALLYGRTIAVDFGGIASTEIEVYTLPTRRIRVKVPQTSPPGQIGPSTQVQLTVTTAGGDPLDQMVADEHPHFTWCPPGPTLTSVFPTQGPLAGDSASNSMTLTGSNYYGTLDGGLGYTYVSFDGFDGPWVTPDEIADASGNTVLTCHLPPQPNRLETRVEVFVKNAFLDLGGVLRTIQQMGPEYFYYLDQPPDPVRVTGGLDGAVVHGNILLQAEAIDDRAIDRVEFRLWQGAGPPDPHGVPPAPYWADYTLLGTDTTWPYEFSWDTTLYAEDDYHIIAVAVDDHVWTTIVPQSGNYPDHPEIYSATGGNIVASNAVTVTVDNDDSTGQRDNPPQAQMLVPADGAVLSVDSGVITLSALVADDLGFLDPSDGDAVAFEIDGGGTLTLDSTQLTYLYTDPATTLDWYLATVTWDGMLWDAGAGAFVKAANGTHQVSVEVWDDHPGDGSAPQSATAGVTITVDSSAVCITSITPGGSDLLAGSDLAGADADPTSGAYHEPLTVTITGDGFTQVTGQPTVFDGTITFAGVPATDVTRVSDTELTVVVPNLELPLSAAGQAIDVSVATATDSQTASDMFYVEDSDPSCVLLGPQDGATVGGLVLLQADARDDSAIASVTYQYSLTGAPGSWVDIATVDAATDDYPFSYEVDTLALFGAGPVTRYFRAMATDDGGNPLPDAEATIVVFDVDQSTYDNPPRVTITSPAQGATVSGTSVILQATVTDLEAAVPLGIGPAQFEIVSAGRSETLGTITVDPASIVWVTTDTWTVAATWDTTEVVGGNPVYPDGSFYMLRSAVTDDASPSNVGYDAVGLEVRNASPPPPPPPPPPGGGGGGGGGCAPGGTTAPAAIFLLLGTAFLVFRRRRPARA